MQKIWYMPLWICWELTILGIPRSVTSCSTIQKRISMPTNEIYVFVATPLPAVRIWGDCPLKGIYGKVGLSFLLVKLCKISLDCLIPQLIKTLSTAVAVRRLRMGCSIWILQYYSGKYYNIEYSSQMSHHRRILLEHIIHPI